MAGKSRINEYQSSYILEHLTAGETPQMIAEALGLKHSTVHYVALQNGIKCSRPPKNKSSVRRIRRKTWTNVSARESGLPDYLV